MIELHSTCFLPLATQTTQRASITHLHVHTMNCSHNNICTTHARVIQARAASTVKNMYRLSSLLPMYMLMFDVWTLFAHTS